MARPHIEPFCDRDVAFKKMNKKGFGPGMHYKMLSMDTDTGACSMTVQFDAGYKQKPGFSWSELEVLVMEGELQLGDKKVGKGYYAFFPAGYAQPALSTEKGAQCLFMYNTGEPSLVESDTHHPLSRLDRFHHTNAYNDIPWALGNIAKPATACGCMIKLLNFNDRTHALTFLYCMTANFQQDNISYHDCAEESYHIWGSSWIMQFGEVPTGGYFWRPPYISHGAFASELGCIALGRVDSKLFNHFHYNPWSTLEENQLRAVARVQQRDPHVYNWMVSNAHNHPHGPEDFELTMPRVGGSLVSREPNKNEAFAHKHGGEDHHHGAGHTHDHDH